MFLFRPAADETRPTPSREGNLLYSTLTASRSHLTFPNYPPRPALARWLGGLECCSAHHQVGGSSPAQGRDLGGMFSPNQGAYGRRQPMSLCRIHVPLCLPPSLPLLLKSTNSSSGEDFNNNSNKQKLPSDTWAAVWPNVSVLWPSQGIASAIASPDSVPWAAGTESLQHPGSRPFEPYLGYL